MNWNDKQKVSEFIKLLIGKCNHEWKENLSNTECIKCGEIIGWRESIPIDNFDASTPSGIWQWKEFMENKLPEVWEGYIMWAGWQVSRTLPHDRIAPQHINFILNPTNFAEYMADHVGEWGWMVIIWGNGGGE